MKQITPSLIIKPRNPSLLKNNHPVQIGLGINVTDENRGISSGQFAEHNTRASAITLMSALDGVLSYLVMNKSIELDTVIKDFEDKFINSVLIHEI